MNSCAEILVSNDGSIDFCISYFKSIPADCPQLLKFSRLILKQNDMIQQAPKVTELYALTYKRNSKPFITRASMVLLSTATTAIMQDSTIHSAFLREYLKTADEMCLFTLIEQVTKHIMYHIELQE